MIRNEGRVATTGKISGNANGKTNGLVSPTSSTDRSEPTGVGPLLSDAQWQARPYDPLPFVIPLVGVGSLSPELVGGKAAQLSELVALGLPVPTAFSLTTTAYRAFTESTGIGAWLSRSVEQLSGSDFAAVSRLASEARERFGSCPIPTEIVAEILTAYETLLGVDGARPVAVRSSASIEDGRVASFAGQCESLLNVCGSGELLKAITSCWASAHSEQALLYRSHHGLLHADCSVGVIVQNLVPADRAAVAFSANPIDGDLSCVVINASWGLGEAIVSGLVNPDYYVVSKHDLTILDRQIACKEVETVPLPDGGTEERPVPADRREVSSLQDSEVREIAEVAVRLEKAKGHPVDVEFAYAGSRLAVLQCRPVTTL